MKCKLKQQQMIEIANSYLKKLGTMHFKKSILSIIDRLLNRLIMSSISWYKFYPT